MDRREANFISVCCEVCAEEFSHEQDHIPKQISCGHSFCDGCLTKLQKRINRQGGRNSVFEIRNRYEITCPKCKEKIVSDKPCSSLPKNYGYIDLVDEVLVENKKRKEKYCKEHPNYVLDMFCHDEEETICLKCAFYGGHKGHDVNTLSEFADRQRRSIKDQIKSLENIIDNYGELSRELKEREQELTDKVEYIRKNIISKFASVQSEIKRVLDNKLEAMLNQLNEYSTVQLSLLENTKHTLNTQEFKVVQTKAKTFLSEADERSIAKEKGLLSEMQAKIDETKNHILCTKHVYEVKVDSADHIVQSLKDLVVAWVCCVKLTKESSHEYITTVINRHGPGFGDCSSAKFGENPFGRIDCKLWCDGALDNCKGSLGISGKTLLSDNTDLIEEEEDGINIFINKKREKYLQQNCKFESKAFCLSRTLTCVHP